MTEGESVITYISKVQQLAKQLTNLGETVTDRQLIAKIRVGLTSSFDSFLLAWDNVPTTDQKLVTFQQRLVKRQESLKSQSSSSFTSDFSIEQALFTKSNATQNKSEQRKDLTPDQKLAKLNRLENRKKKTRCFKCGHKGHWGGECPFYSDDSESDHDSHSRSKKHIPIAPVLARHSHNRKKSHRRSQRSHAHLTASQINGDSNSDSSDASSEAYCVTTSALSDSFWYADSGATESMTDKRHWFHTFKDIPDQQWSVTIADGHKVWVRGIGNIIVYSFVTR